MHIMANKATHHNIVFSSVIRICEILLLISYPDNVDLV